MPRSFPLKTILLLAVIALAACTRSGELPSYDPTATASIEKRQLSYAEQRQLLGEQEGRQWGSFIDYSGLTYRSNLIGQAVIEGVVTNSASVATYKDLVLHIKFSSRTGTVLAENDAVIYEFLPPGGSLRFKRKFKSPAYAATIDYDIVGADYTIK